jgi:hypothetical protein
MAKEAADFSMVGAAARDHRRSGMDGSGKLLGLPGPRQQPLELVSLGPSGDHALEHVRKPGQGPDPIQACLSRKSSKTRKFGDQSGLELRGPLED